MYSNSLSNSPKGLLDNVVIRELRGQETQLRIQNA